MESEAPHELSDGRNSVLGKAFLILDCFGPGEATVTLAELSARSRLPKSTVHRIASSLVEWGALEREFGEFRLGLRLFELGSLVPRWRVIREAALPFMADLFETTHQMVNLALLEDDGNVVYLEKLRGHRNAISAARIGGRMPASCTGVGKAMLAFSPASTVQQVVSRPLVARTPYSITDVGVLRRELYTIRKEHVAYDREEAVLGHRCVAAPVLDQRNRAIAALSVSIRDASFTGPERMAVPVQTAARGLARALRGALPGSPS